MGNRMKASILGIVAAFALIGCRGSSKSNSVADNMENKPVIRPEKPVDSNVTMQDYLLIGAKGRAGKGSVYKCNLEGTKCREFLGGNILFTSNNVTKEAKSNVIQLAMGDNFGSSIFGNKKNIFIGSNGKKGFDLYGKESSDSPNGAVYQCDLSGKNCSILDTTLLKLTANDSFGSSIFVTSSKILVGAIGRDSGDALPKIIGANYRFDLGAIFQFDLDGKNGVEFIAGKNKNSKIRDELKGNDYLGTSIVATKRNIFIGAKDKIRGNGRVFKCNLEGAECQSFYATDINFITNDNFGSSLAATDKQIFIGAIGRDSSPTNISSLYGKDNSSTNVSPLYDTGVVFSCNLDASSCVKLVGGRDVIFRSALH